MTAVQPIMDVFNVQTGLDGKYTRISTSKFLPTVPTGFQTGKAIKARGIMMIFISTALVILATLVGVKFRPVEEGG